MSNKRNETVLVLGGSYFIGYAITEALICEGYRVLTINRGTRENVPGIERNLICDRNDKERFAAALHELTPDYVVDVSCTTGEQADSVCRAVDGARVKALVFISSSAVYDLSAARVPFRESDPLAENSCWRDYGTGKIDAECVYYDYFRHTGIRGVILRPPYVFGERNYACREKMMFDHILKGRTVIVPKREPALQFIYSRDLAQIVCRMLYDCSADGIYNVGNGTALTAREWVEACAEAAKKNVRIIEYDHAAAGRNVRDFFPFYAYDNILDVSKIRAVCDIETDFGKAMRSTFEAYVRDMSSFEVPPRIINAEKEILKELGIG